MIISCRGWVLAASLVMLGEKARAQSSISNTSGDNEIGVTAAGDTRPSLSSSSSTRSTSTIATTIAPSLPPAITSSPAPTQTGLSADFQYPTTAILLNRKASFKYFLSGPESLKPTEKANKILLVLLQTSAQPNEAVEARNSKVIAQLASCKGGMCTPDFWAYTKDGKILWTEVDWTFQSDVKIRSEEKFFLCFGTNSESGGVACETYSHFFVIQSDSGNSDAGFIPADTDQESEYADEGFTGDIEDPQKPSGILTFTENERYITYKDILKTRLTPSTESTRTNVDSTLISSTGIPLPPNTSSGAPESPTAARPRGKSLSTGAIVGIALGSLVLVSLLAIIALFFCIRRRRRAQSGTTHEQAMLTQSHPDTSSRDPLAEKDTAVRTLIHPNSNDSSFLYTDQNDTAARQTLIPIGTAYGGSEDQANNNFHNTETTRGIQTSPYDAPSTISSAAPVFVAASSTPRRKPTNASTASAGAISALSRNISSATTASANSYGEYPVHSQLQGIGEEGTSPIPGDSLARYGETPRHFPQISDRGSNPPPFLSEPGMSAEEIARLDEEERRIDAAIAAADEQRDRDRAGSGLR